MIAAAAIFAYLISWAVTYYLSRTLRRRGVVAEPTERSSHTVPTPVGGGIAVIAGVAAGLALISGIGGASPLSPGASLALIIGGGLAGLSLLDDLKDLPVAVRLAGQALAVGGFLAVGHLVAPPVAGLPTWLIVAVACMAWLWFVNLFNFMDGIDGIAGAETLTITLGVILVVSMTGHATEIYLPALLVAAAVAGFLVWNWHPARIFMGDVGSVPLGFVLGWMLLSLAAAGQWAPALILPAYYLADATITLFRRLFRGEKVWRAHKEHFYQRAHQAGLSHSQVVIRIAAANICLVALAALATQGHIAIGIAGAVFVVGVLLRHLASPRERKR